jgi:bifunctional non-homologous end joining protein LigD
VKEFSRHLAAGLEKDDPAHFTTNSRKAGRAGKIFIDYLRNDFSATSVAAYSTRAREGAPIAMPLAWSELEKLEKPDSYTLPVTAKRLSRLKKDPWKEMLELPQALP